MVNALDSASATLAAIREGFDMPLDAALLDLSPNRKQRRAGGYGRRIIKTMRRNGRLFEFHATKGWRSYRDPARS